MRAVHLTFVVQSLCTPQDAFHMYYFHSDMETAVMTQLQDTILKRSASLYKVGVCDCAFPVFKTRLPL